MQACTSRGNVHMGVLKSSSVGKDRAADAAEHILVIDIEAKSASPLEMPHVGLEDEMWEMNTCFTGVSCC